MEIREDINALFHRAADEAQLILAENWAEVVSEKVSVELIKAWKELTFAIVEANLTTFTSSEGKLPIASATGLPGEKVFRMPRPEEITNETGSV